jgi:hypothetical protein
MVVHAFIHVCGKRDVSTVYSHRFQFEAGHLPTAFHLNPDLLEKPEELATMVTAFIEMKGVHFVLMGADADFEDSLMSDSVDLGDRVNDPVKLFVLYFLQRKITFVSEVNGGYKGTLVFSQWWPVQFIKVGVPVT